MGSGMTGFWIIRFLTLSIFQLVGFSSISHENSNIRLLWTIKQHIKRLKSHWNNGWKKTLKRLKRLPMHFQQVAGTFIFLCKQNYGSATIKHNKQVDNHVVVLYSLPLFSHSLCTLAFYCHCVRHGTYVHFLFFSLISIRVLVLFTIRKQSWIIHLRTIDSSRAWKQWWSIRIRSTEEVTLDEWWWKKCFARKTNIRVIQERIREWRVPTRRITEALLFRGVVGLCVCDCVWVCAFHRWRFYDFIKYSNCHWRKTAVGVCALRFPPTLSFIQYVLLLDLSNSYDDRGKIRYFDGWKFVCHAYNYICSQHVKKYGFR